MQLLVLGLRVAVVLLIQIFFLLLALEVLQSYLCWLVHLDVRLLVLRLQRALTLVRLSLHLLLHTVEQVKLPLSFWLCYSWSARKSKARVLILHKILCEVLSILKVCIWLRLVNCKVVIGIILQAVLHEREIVYAHDAVTLQQLCLLLLVLTDQKLLVIKVTSVIQHATYLVAVTFVLQKEIERVCLKVCKYDMVPHVWLLLNLLRVVKVSLVLNILVHSKSIILWGSNLFALMVADWKLTYKLRPLLLLVQLSRLQVVLILQHVCDRLQLWIAQRLHRVVALVFAAD